MDQHKAILFRILVAGVLVYAGWTYLVRPAKGKLEALQQARETQSTLISQAGGEFESREHDTAEAHATMHTVSVRMLSTFADDEHTDAREQISKLARLYGIEINRIEPLRTVDYTNSASTRNAPRTPDSRESKPSVKFQGQGMRVELDGSFPGFTGFLHDLGTVVPTIKMESFRMVSSGNGNGRMIAEFMKFNLIDAPFKHEHEEEETAEHEGDHGHGHTEHDHAHE